MPGWLDKPGMGLEVLSNYCKEPLTLDTVFPYQKSICALNFTNRGCSTLVGRSHVSVVVTNVWL